MILRPITDGTISGTGTIVFEGRILGGVLISTNNTNAAAVTIRRTDSSGVKIFDISTLVPGFHIAPIIINPASMNGVRLDATDRIYYSITGTGASAQLYEWLE